MRLGVHELGFKVARTQLLKSKMVWLGLIAAVCVLALACSTGSYPVDVFTEMHYQQSYRSQEPPRLLPAEDAVPFTKESSPLRSLEPISQADVLVMVNPIPRNAATEELGRQIFMTNCAVCHGPTGRSDSFIADAFRRLNITPPADFATAGSITGTANDGSTDGLAFWSISNGITNMPAFRNLLTQEDRWTVIHYLRVLSEQATP